MSAPTEPRTVSADRVRRHLLWLRDRKVGLATVARLTGLPRRELLDLLLGPRTSTGEHGPLPATMPAARAELVLAVDADGTLCGRAPSHPQDAAPRRSLDARLAERPYPFLAQALVGADLDEVARRAGLPVAKVRSVAAGEAVPHLVAVKVNLAVVLARTQARTIATGGGWGHRMLGEGVGNGGR